MKKKVSLILKYLPYIFHSIYFNFYYLPIYKAWKLPILLYKPKFLSIKGKVIIDSPTVKTGMIQLGLNMVSSYPNTGIKWENEGTIIFKEKIIIGNNSTITIGKKGTLFIGSNVTATTSLRIACFHKINIGNHTLIGWDCTIMDTDFHQFQNTKGELLPCYGPITIGEHNWLSMKCIILKNTTTPNHSYWGACSILNKSYSQNPENCLYAGNPIQIKKQGIKLNNNPIEYE